jgi:hypothetical protein
MGTDSLAGWPMADEPRSGSPRISEIERLPGNPFGTGHMDVPNPTSSRPIAAILMAACLVIAPATRSRAHGGGGGHGCGRHGGGGHAHGGYDYGGAGGGSAFGGYGRGLASGADRIGASRIGWPSFPEDLPLKTLHRFLVQHRPLGWLRHQP